MKTLLTLLFIFFSTHLVAQEWRLVVANDTVYYTSDASTIYLPQKYLRVVWIDSAQVQGNDTVSYFFKTLRHIGNPFNNTIQNCVDSIGASWQGHKHVKKMNGDEELFNFKNETIHFKPQLSIGSTWTITNDSNNIEYRATIASTGTQIIDGAIDSIKTITINTYSNGTPTANYFDGKQLIISKNHGWISCYEWYTFPYNTFSTQVSFNPPILSGLHNRVDRQVTDSRMGYIDLSLLMAPGNEFQHKTFQPSSGSSLTTYNYDSIMAYTSINPNLGVVTYRRYRYGIAVMSHGTFYDSSCTIRIDTIYSGDSTAKRIRKHIFPEAKVKKATELGLWYYGLDTICNSHNMLVSINNSGLGSLYFDTNCLKYQLSLGPPVLTSYYLAENLGMVHTTNKYPGGISGTISWEDSTLYFKINGCERGIKAPYTCWPNSIKDQESSNISLHPIPSQSTLYLKDETNSTKNYEILIYSIPGQLIKSLKLTGSRQFDISFLSPGIYMAYIKNEYGVARVKFIKE